MSNRTNSLNIGKTQNAVVDWAINFSPTIFEAEIPANTNLPLVVPSGVNTFFCSNIKVDVNVVPSVDTGAFTSTTSVRNPVGRIFGKVIQAGDTLNFYNASSNPAGITVEFFNTTPQDSQ
jgi:hypothetical protein